MREIGKLDSLSSDEKLLKIRKLRRDRLCNEVKCVSKDLFAAK
jgi:hypothetical protein